MSLGRRSEIFEVLETCQAIPVVQALTMKSQGMQEKEHGLRYLQKVRMETSLRQEIGTFLIHPEQSFRKPLGNNPIVLTRVSPSPS